MKSGNQLSVEPMSEMISFQYSGFWDVPLGILVMHWGTAFLMIMSFDEERDEYDDQYYVYILPESLAASFRDVRASEGFWKDLGDKHLKLAGRVPIRSVKFDATGRKQLGPCILDKFVDETARKKYLG